MVIMGYWPLFWLDNKNAFLNGKVHKDTIIQEFGMLNMNLTKQSSIGIIIKENVSIRFFSSMINEIKISFKIYFGYLKLRLVLLFLTQA